VSSCTARSRSLLRRCKRFCTVIKMECSECARLKEKCEQLERAYAYALQELTDRAGISSAHEFLKMQAVADETRSDIEAARAELDEHKRIHAEWKQGQAAVTDPSPPFADPA
jgi:hypothetical protein